MALTALFTGASGLATFSTDLDVVGNNLANLNTTGYKAQRTSFRDLVYQTLNAGSVPSGTFGGVNPTQIGFGVGIGSVNTLFRQGTTTPTGRSLDAALQGTGFFVLSNGQFTAYSRNGGFSVDAAGFLVDPNTGFRVQRTGVVGEGSATEPAFQTPGINDIHIPFGAGAAGVPTTTITFQGNLSTSLAVGDVISTGIQFYDTQSAPHAVVFTFEKTGINTFEISAVVNGVNQTLSATTITFDTDGLLVSPATIDMDVTGLSGVGAQTITLELGTPGQTEGLTQFGGGSTASAVNQDGSASGTLTDISIDLQGQLIGLFTNGRKIPVAQLAIAGFNNEDGLLRTGNNYFISSPASGEPVVGPAGAGGRGLVQGGSLEGSNVDIATEFAQLIIAQRGFQVNARTVTAANETLQELANIIR